MACERSFEALPQACEPSACPSGHLFGLVRPRAGKNRAAAAATGRTLASSRVNRSAAAPSERRRWRPWNRPGYPDRPCGPAPRPKPRSNMRRAVLERERIRAACAFRLRRRLASASRSARGRGVRTQRAGFRRPRRDRGSLASTARSRPVRKSAATWPVTTARRTAHRHRAGIHGPKVLCAASSRVWMSSSPGALPASPGRNRSSQAADYAASRRSIASMRVAWLSSQAISAAGSSMSKEGWSRRRAVAPRRLRLARKLPVGFEGLGNGGVDRKGRRTDKRAVLEGGVQPEPRQRGADFLKPRDMSAASWQTGPQGRHVDRAPRLRYR